MKVMMKYHRAAILVMCGNCEAITVSMLGTILDMSEHKKKVCNMCGNEAYVLPASSKRHLDKIKRYCGAEE